MKGKKYLSESSVLSPVKKNVHSDSLLLIAIICILLLLLSGSGAGDSGRTSKLYSMEGMENPADKHTESGSDAHGTGSSVKHDETEKEKHEGEAADGHNGDDKAGHGAPGVGYIGLERGADIDAAGIKDFRERVAHEAADKGRLDQFRFIFMGLTFVVVCLAFAKIRKINAFTVKLHSAIDWHTLGTVTGLILVVLVIPSGIIITFFFMPTSTGVYRSVEVMLSNPALAFFRNMHNWSSEVFIWLMLLHAARTVSTGTFLGNRKFIWLTGAVAAAVGWVAFLSGSFMRGDQEALEGFEHMMYSFRLFPGGGYIAQFFSGEYTLIRLTALHVAATIFVMSVLIAMHVLMRKIHVLVVNKWKKALVYFGALTLLMTVQSIFMEAPFIRGLENIPTVSGIEITKPPWPIYFLIQGENWFGADAMVIILTVVFVPLIVFPYVIDLLPVSHERKQAAGEWSFYAGVFLLILISFIAAGGPVIAHIS